MKISVIIPTYKPENYIFECLHSLSLQTLNKDEFEVIIILNGCNEPWLSNINSTVSGLYNPLNTKIIQTDIGGVSNARNIGISNSVGEYLTFIDDDDYVSKSYLEDLLKVASPDSVVISNSRAFIDGKSEWIDSYGPHIAYIKCANHQEQKILHARSLFSGPCMKLLHRNLINGFSFDTRINIGEDGLFMFSISKNFKKIAYAAPDAIYYRRYRPLSATTKYRPLSYWLKNGFKLHWKFFIAWLKHPFSYNLPFAASRQLANIKATLWHIQNFK